MNITLRELRQDEHDVVCGWAMAQQWPGLVKGRVLVPEEFPAILALQGHISFAMSEPGLTVTGFGQIWLSPNGSTNLVRILVDPARRGQGLGKHLCSLLLAEALARAQGRPVRLRVQKSNFAAVAVYRAIGFHEVDAESNEQVWAMMYPALD